MNCPTCNNAMAVRRVKLDKTGPLCTPLYGRTTYCAYCEWKGTAGPGKELRDIARDLRKEL